VRTREEIYHGLKAKFSRDEVLTGRELCTLLDIDYDEIVAVRQQDQQRNLEYFITELLKIVDIRRMIVRILQTFRNDDLPDPPHETHSA
jgi:hypothetical protein